MNQVTEYRIMSIDGSKIYRKTHLVGQGENQGLNVRTGDGKLNENMFAGYLSRSLDTEKLLEVYSKHKSELKHNDYKKVINRESNPILPLLVRVSPNTWRASKSTRVVHTRHTRLTPSQ